MTDEIVKRASFGFDADFGDLSKVKPTGPKKTTKPAAKPKAATPKSAAKSPRKPKSKPPVRQAQEDLADRLAKSQGFTSREAVSHPAPPVLMKKRRRVQHDEPVDQLSIRGPVRILNGFIDYCEDHKLSYWEGLERLVQEAQ